MSDRYRFEPRVFRLGGDPPPHEALARLTGVRRPVLLDGAAGTPRRFSLLGFDPVATSGAEKLSDLRSLLGRLELVPGDDLPDAFHGGFLGALAYDLGVEDEGLDLPTEPWDFPLVVGGLYVDFIVRDEQRGESWLVLGDEPGDGRPAVAERRAAVEDRLARPAAREELRALGALQRCVPPGEHERRVAQTQEAIVAGEIYQANVAHRLVCPVAGDPVELYLRLRKSNPAPYMGYLAFEAGAVISSSPELLLEFDPGTRRARTRPIKGTRPRGATASEDAENAARLLASDKDRAELAMIVDLARNDLGRVAEVGSVCVGDFPRLESYAAVHHLLADVECETRAGVDALEALSALFPGGSITGAPKLRSMEVIAEVEGEGRGFFTGSMGLIDLRGRAVFNILIRTLLWRPSSRGRGEASFRVGGGITWASDPAREDEETLDKGRALAEALGGP